MSLGGASAGSGVERAVRVGLVAASRATIGASTIGQNRCAMGPGRSGRDRESGRRGGGCWTRIGTAAVAATLGLEAATRLSDTPAIQCEADFVVV